MIAGAAIHLLLAILWLFLGEEPTPERFLQGWLAGFLILALFARVVPGEGYVSRTFAFLRFFVVFARELVVSNLVLAGAILRKSRQEVAPTWVDYPVAHLRDGEVLLLSHCITLTPGTTTVEVAEDRSSLLLHVFAGGDPDAVRTSIRTALEEPMLAFTRPPASAEETSP